MDNIIDFSAKHQERLDKIKEGETEASEDFEELALVFATHVSHDVVYCLKEMGYDITEHPDTLLDLMGLMETIRALMYRCIGEKYYYQSVSEQIFGDSTKDSENGLGAWNRLELEEIMQEIFEPDYDGDS